MKRLNDIRTRGRVAVAHSCAVLPDGSEVELDYETVDHYKEDAFQVHLSDDGLTCVVGYLVQDSDCENPMTSCDGNGSLYHSDRDYEGYDPREIDNALCLEVEEPDPDTVITVDGIDLRLGELAEMAVADTLDADPAQALLDLDMYGAREALLTDAGGDMDVLYGAMFEEITATIEDGSGGSWYEEYRHQLDALYRKHWRQIVSPFVVEASFGGRGGGCTAALEFRGDYDSVDAVWVAGDLEIQNITSGMPEMDDDLKLDEWLRGKAYEYAKVVLEEYSTWAEGDCYGCVVQTFKRTSTSIEDDWVAVPKGDEACWGFIGSDYAIEALENDFIKPALASVTE